MILAKIRVSGIDANLVEWKEVPAGIRGAQVAFEYADPTWDGLEKTVVFRGCVTRDVLRAGTLVEIPPECVETPGAPLKVGVYGTDPDNAVAIPTLWADLGRVKSAADPSGDESAGDGLPVWAQILALIGDLDDLGTAAKDTLVAAINEAATKGGGSVSEEEVWAIVDRYLQEHPVTVTETDPTVPSWAKQPQKPTYTAAEVGARPASWMPSASDVGADPAGTAAAAVSGHNTATDAHNDIRLDLKKINDKLTAFFDSDDQTLDELSEIVAYITSNKSLIDAITTSKVSVADIIDNLTTNAANRPLSAAQGVVLNGLISTVSNNLSKYQLKGDYALKSEIPAKLPNPNALTINGTSYDGSTPVNIFIEGGSDAADIQAIIEQYMKDHPVVVTETDPTVPSWAKQPQKPTYTAAEVGARPVSWMPSAADVGADPAGTAAAAVSGHNIAADAHNDIRLDLKKINDKLTVFFDSDDQTLDELSEIVAYITSNKSLIDAITTSKVSVSDIVDNLTTNAANRPLSAAQGVVLNGLISTVSSNLSKYQLKGDYALKSEIPAKLPNPAHLTINGYRYDGSKTLFMDVQERSFYEKPGATLADNASVTSGQYTWINYNAVDGYEKAQVIFDGVTYACPITFKKSITEYGDESFFYIGNYNNNAPEYPFTFFGYVGSDSANLSVSGGTHTISVTLDAFVKKIDPKFYDTGTTTKTLFYERDSDADGGIDDYGYIPELVAGVTYEVEWGGEVYTDTAKKVIDVLGVSQDDTVVLPDGTEYQPGNDVAWGDLSFYIGGEPTMPIRMEYMEGGSTMLFNMTGVAGVRHVKIYVVEKTPSGGGGAPYVAQDTAPDDISVLWVDTSDNSGNGGGVSSWNDLKDRPFGTIPAQYELEWDGVIGDRLAIDLSILGEEGFLVKVSDKAYTKKELIGKYCIDTSDNELAIRSDDFTVLLPGSFSLFDGIVSVVYDASVTNAAFGAPDGYITNGTYFMCYPGNNYYVRGIATAPERIEKLDVKYIPNLRSLAPFYTQNLLEWSETGKWHKIYKSVDDRDYMEMWESIKTQCFAAVNLYENGTVLIPLCCDIALEEYWGRALLPPSLSGATNLYEIVVHFRLSEFNYLLLDSGIPAH